MPFYLVQEGPGDRLQVQLDDLESGSRALRVFRGADTPADQPTFFLDGQGSSANVALIRGAPGYLAIISDTCGFYTRGPLASDGTAQGPTQIANLAAFMIGANSDIGPGATASVYVSFSNLAGLTHEKYWRGGEARPVHTVNRDGDLAWSDGAAADDVSIARSAAATLTVGIAAANNPALRVAEAADGETALLLRRNVTGAFSLVRVSMGAVDSGGAGFKLLRVPN